MRKLLTISLLLCLLPSAQTARADGVTRQAFLETFNENNGTGGRDDSYSGNVASNTIVFDQDGWISGKNLYGGKECMRFGTGSNIGTCTTPDIIIIGTGKTATLTFNAAGWGSGTNTLTVSANEGVTLTGNTQVTLTNSTWTAYTVNIELTTAKSVQLTFSGKRGFLDDVKVVENVTAISAPTLTDEGTFWPNINEADANKTITLVPADSTTVYYTTDGSEPSPSNGIAAALTTGITIAGTTTVKARAYYKTVASSIVTRTYTQGTTVSSIAAFKALADGTETRLAISDVANARVLHAHNGKQLYLRDNSGAICFDFGTTAVFNPTPAHNQHVAGWIVGRKQTENGLVKLVATENTTTDYLAMAAPVTEADTEPTVIAPDEIATLSSRTGDWVTVSDLRAQDYSVANNFGLSNYTAVYDGALVDVSAIVTANNVLSPVFYNNITPVVYVLDEDKDFASPNEDIQNATVRLKRTLSKDYWNTFVVPINLTQIDGIVRTYDHADGNTMVFSNAGNIEAGKPYLVKPTADIENPVYSNVTLSATAAASIENGDYSFVGTYSPKDLETNKTVLFLKPDGKLYYPSGSNNQLRGMRAFFKVPANSNGVRLLLDGDATDIASIIDGEEWPTGNDRRDLHNLNGQRVAKPQKGLYIRNGKKIIIH